MADTANLMRATANYPQYFATQFVAASETTIYTCPANKAVSIATATLCNTSDTPRNVYLSSVKSGGTAGAANRVKIITLQPEESCVVEQLVGDLLGPGDFISGYCTAASAVAIKLSGTVSS